MKDINFQVWFLEKFYLGKDKIEVDTGVSAE